MDFRDKLIPWSALAAWRAKVRAAGHTLVVTNGCFDLLHAGHVAYLQAARHLGDVLLVGLNSDASVRQLKGESRPINGETDRATVLAGLEAVDAVCIFDELRATRFLSVAQPDLYVKGGDFTVDQLPAEERRIVESFGGVVRIMPHLPGRSTSALLEKMARLR